MSAPIGHRDQILERVRAVAQQLHSEGFVHGNIEASNIFYKFEGSDFSTMRVMLIAFDEAGRIGQVHYGPIPFFIYRYSKSSWWCGSTWTCDTST